MNAGRRWRLFGILLGLGLGIATYLIPPEMLGATSTALGLDRLTPFAAPPIGIGVRAALAVAVLLAGVMLGWIAARLFARGTAVEDADLAEGYAPAYAPPAMEGWRAPVPVSAPVDRFVADAEPVGAVPLGADTASEGIEPAPFVRAGAGADGNPLFEQRASAPAEAMAVAARSAHNASEPQETREETMAAADTTPPAAAPSPAHVGSGPAQSAPLPDPALARLEAAVADLVRYGPRAVTERFDGIDARLTQMAQQMAEVAALARASARTPIPTPAAPAPAPATMLPPADPARRAAVAEAARRLRAELGEASGFA